MVTTTLTSTPEGNLMAVTCLTCSLIQSRSIYLLKILISNLSQVLDPLPQGVLLQVILRFLLGILTGPVILIPCSLAFLMISLVTCSMEANLMQLMVILNLWLVWSTYLPFSLISAIVVKIINNYYLINTPISIY